MFKWIFLLVGLAVGFGGGVWWGVRNPEQAQGLAAEEERRVLEAKKQVAEAFKKKLDEIINSSRQRPTATGSGFLPGARGPAGPNPELVELQKEAEQEIRQLDQQIDATSKK